MIAEQLANIRKLKKLTMKDVAESIGVSLSAYQKYENGTRDVSTEMINKIADFYGVTTDYLLGREEQPNPLATLNVTVNDEKFIEIYQDLPDYAKQIFIDTMIKLTEAAKKK